jgi:hypothetical protein
MIGLRSYCWAAVLAMLVAAPCLASVAVEEEEVVFRFAAPGAGSVHVVGDFNGWNPTMDLMVLTEAGFEIRLYLLPGTYRYCFLVDGVSKPDPDNPCLEDGGKSCFTLLERAGALEVTLTSGTRAPGALSSVRVTPSVRIDAVAGDEAASLFAAARIAGSIDEKADADLEVGLTEDLVDGEADSGASYLLRCTASYRFERGSLSIFSRPAAELAVGDPLRLIGSVGPYAYPMNLFTRGARFDGTLPLGVDTRLLFASRLSGYRSGLEGTPSESDLFSMRDFVDSDIYGMRFGTTIGAAAISYLYRQDRRPKDGAWRYAALGDELYRGYEKEEIQGVWLSVAGAEGMTAEGEMLFGTNLLSATGAAEDEAAPFRDVSLEAELVRGYRFGARVARSWSGFQSAFVFSHTTLEADEAAGEQAPDGWRSSVEGTVEMKGDPLAIGLRAKLESYSAHSTGSVFWLGRTNFWLDGDEVTCGLIPFLSERDVFEASISAAWKCGPPGDLPWGTGLRASLTQRGTGANGAPLLRELRLSDGIALHPRVEALVDMRGITYDYGGMKRDFVDAYVSVRAHATEKLWCAIGAGVDPYGFDRWLYAFSDHGREAYLEDRGVFDALAASGEEAAMKALIDGEEALAEDWIFTLEAGFTF